MPRRKSRKKGAAAARKPVADPGKLAELKALQNRWTVAAIYVVGATRRELGLSQDELAGRIGWSREKLGRFEAAGKKVELSDIFLLAYGLKLEPEILIGRIKRWHSRSSSSES